MPDIFSMFMQPDNLIKLGDTRSKNPGEYYQMLLAWYQALGKGTGLSLSKMEEIVDVVAPSYREERQPDESRVKTWEELCTMDQWKTYWVVDRFLYGKGLSILSADPKCGKSTLARWLAACVIAGRDFLDRSCPAGRVLYFSLEDPPHVIADDIKQFSRYLGLSWADTEGSLFVFRKRANKNIVDEMVEEVHKRDINLVVIDTLFRFLGCQGESDYGAITAEMEKIREPLTKMDRTHILALHHNRKQQMGANQGDAFRAQLGSTALRGSTDVNMCLTMCRDGETRKFHRAEGRIADPIKDLLLTRRPDHFVHVPAPSEGQERDKARLEEFVDYIQGNPGVTKGEAQQHLKDKQLGLGNAHWAKFWDGLEADGVIRVDKKKLYFNGVTK